MAAGGSAGLSQPVAIRAQKDMSNGRIGVRIISISLSWLSFLITKNCRAKKRVSRRGAEVAGESCSYLMSNVACALLAFSAPGVGRERGREAGSGFGRVVAVGLLCFNLTRSSIGQGWGSFPAKRVVWEGG